MGVVSGVAEGVLEHAMRLMGTVPLLKGLYLDPTLVRRVLERVGSLIAEVDRRIAEMDVGALRMGDDMGYKKGPMISPRSPRRLVFPWRRRCAGIAHRHGLPFILHACGNLEPVMEDLIGHVGMDAKHSYEDSSCRLRRQRPGTGKG